MRQKMYDSDLFTTKGLTVELDEIRELLKDRNISAVAEKAEVSYPMLQRFMRGEVDDPSYKMIIALIKYLESQQITKRVF